jgi:hypothetical protein
MGSKLLTPNDLQPNLEVNEFNMVVNVNGNQLPLALAKLLVANETANSLTRIADALERAYPPPVDYVRPGTPPEATDG